MPPLVARVHVLEVKMDLLLKMKNRKIKPAILSNRVRVVFV